MNAAVDTNAYTAYRERNPRLTRLAQEAELIGLPIVVAGEIRFGSQNGSRPTENEASLAEFLAQPRVRVLHMTMETTWLFGEIATASWRRGISLNHNDLWIAAICKQYSFTLATRDRDFAHIPGLLVVDF